MSKIDELIGVYIEASSAVVWEAEKRGLCPMTLDMQRAGIAAVVRALRDDIIPERMRLTRANDTCTRSSLRRCFNKILGAAGDEVADTVAQAVEPRLREVTGASPVRTATAPAPAVCVWVRAPYTALYSSCCDEDYLHNVTDSGMCHRCGKPIKFTEAQR